MRIPYAVIGEARSLAELQAAIDGTVAINRVQIREGRVPALYMAGIVYEQEIRGEPLPNVERIQTAADAFRLGHADCDGLAPYRAAELLERGVPARALIVPSAVGYHVVTITREGREDPSAVLGMLEGINELGASGGDARVSARARRRRFVTRLVSKAERLMEAAAGTSGEQRQMLVRGAQRALRAARPLAAREREPHPNEPSDEHDDEGETDATETALEDASRPDGAA